MGMRHVLWRLSICGNAWRIKFFFSNPVPGQNRDLYTRDGHCLLKWSRTRKNAWFIRRFSLVSSSSSIGFFRWFIEVGEQRYGVCCGDSGLLYREKRALKRDAFFSGESVVVTNTLFGVLFLGFFSLNKQIMFGVQCS